jgi:hypothetical protein
LAISQQKQGDEMHYANGREAKKGDLVRGRGYNVKHEIIGKVVNLRPGPSCNLSVAHVDFYSPVFFLSSMELDPQSPDTPFATVKVDCNIEFGQTDRFLAIDPASGEVLPPVDPPPVAAAVIPISAAASTNATSTNANTAGNAASNGPGIQSGT